LGSTFLCSQITDIFVPDSVAVLKIKSNFNGVHNKYTLLGAEKFEVTAGCRRLVLLLVQDTLFDEFVIAHTLGWFGKSIMVRSLTLSWMLSIGFEMLEV
jgi:hypothetical protein